MDPKKEIKIIIESVSLWRGEEAGKPQTTAPSRTTTQPTKPVQTQTVLMPISIPTLIPISNFDFSSLYAKGSLSRSSHGISFSLRNPLGPATIIAPSQVVVDGNVLPKEKIVLVTSSGKIRNTDILQTNHL